MNYKTLLITGTLAAVFLSGCAGSTAKPSDKQNSVAREYKVDTNSYYSGEKEIQTPNQSFGYCFMDECGKHGTWIDSDNVQYVKYTGNRTRPRFIQKVNSDIQLSRTSTQEFRGRAAKALKKAIAKIKNENRGYFKYGGTIQLVKNGSEENGFSGFCIKGMQNGQAYLKKSALASSLNFLREDPDARQYMDWELEHCYSPILENGKISGFKEYDQSVCQTFVERSQEDIRKEKLEKRFHNFANGIKNSKGNYEGHVHGLISESRESCWKLGDYMPKDTIGYSPTPAEFTYLIYEFDKEFKKELKGGK
jgi:hypothetical protein